MPDFDVAMLACHIASCLELFLYFTGFLSCASSLSFELVLLCVKTILELFLDALSTDLVFHHGLMVIAASASLFYYDEQVCVVLFAQNIHIPLAVQYARRLSGASRGSWLDISFAAAWLLVVFARGGALLSACVQARAASTPIWLLYPGTIGLLAMDFQWTKETFQKRPKPPGALLLLAGGFATGAFHQSDLARCFWASVCGATLLVVGATLACMPASAERRARSGDQKLTTD